MWLGLLHLNHLLIFSIRWPEDLQPPLWLPGKGQASDDTLHQGQTGQGTFLTRTGQVCLDCRPCHKMTIGPSTQARVINPTEKGQMVAVFRLCGPKVLCHNYSIPPLEHGTSHRMFITNRRGCVPIKLNSQNPVPAGCVNPWPRAALLQL